MTDIVVTVSSIIIALTVIITFFSKTRKWLVNKMAKDVDFSVIDKRSNVYKDHKIVSRLETFVTEDTFKKLIDNQHNIETAIHDLRMSTLRLEIGRLIDHEPHNKDTIYRLFDKYKKLGGNSYMCSEVKKWEQAYVNNPNIKS